MRVVGLRVVAVQEEASTLGGSTDRREEIAVLGEIINVLGEHVNEWYDLMYKTSCAGGDLVGGIQERLFHDMSVLQGGMSKQGILTSSSRYN